MRRPVNLDLRTIHFPLPAIISILHRISGVIVFLFIPFLLWLLQASLGSISSFADLQDSLSHPFIKGILWFVLSSLIYHLFAGVRHLIMDLGFAESLKTARLTSVIVLILSISTSIVIGVWLW